MPTVFSHAVVPLAIGLGVGRDIISRRLLGLGVLLAMVPDADVAGLYLGVPYADEFGHRGASHSLAMAACLAVLGACAARALRTSFMRAFLFLFISTASHGLLDTFTNGGLGVALAWPWSETRFFAPVRFIDVSPIGSRFFSHRGLDVLRSELLTVVLPALCLGILLCLKRVRK